MDPWSKIAEARIQEWLRKPAHERDATRGDGVSSAPLEVQLLADVRALYAQARATRDAEEAARLREQAAQIGTRILVLLEESGRPLAAQQFAVMLTEARAGNDTARDE